MTDAGLKELSALKNLDWLNLSETQVSDAGLNDLKDLKSLLTVDAGDAAPPKEAPRSLKEIQSMETLRKHWKLTGAKWSQLKAARLPWPSTSSTKVSLTLSLLTLECLT